MIGFIQTEFEELRRTWRIARYRREAEKLISDLARLKDKNSRLEQRIADLIAEINRF